MSSAQGQLKAHATEDGEVVLDWGQEMSGEVTMSLTHARYLAHMLIYVADQAELNKHAKYGGVPLSLEN